MDELTFWRSKLVQLLHVPAGAPLVSERRAVGDAAYPLREPVRSLVVEVAEALVGLGWWGTRSRAAEALAAASDGPNLGAREDLPHPVWGAPARVTHPLCAAPIDLGPVPVAGAAPVAKATLPADAAPKATDLLGALGACVRSGGWSDLSTLRAACVCTWRLLHADVAGSEGTPRLPPWWTWVPADAALPDVSVWDRTRMASAFAFFARAPEDLASPGSDEPWLLSFEVGPVGRFIDESRSARDLWAGSFLLAELSFAAMQPVLQHYGKEAILYPDLRGNPRADRSLWDDPTLDGLLPRANPRTRAAVIPNHWVAVISQGQPAGVNPTGMGSSALLPVADLAGQCVDAAASWWRGVTDRVLERLRAPVGEALKQIGAGRWEDFEAEWRTQHGRVLTAVWTASRWPWLDPEHAPVGRALMGQGKQTPVDVPRTPREEWFGTFVPAQDADDARGSRAAQDTHGPDQRDGRGSDYQLQHHRLQALHAARRGARPAALPVDLLAGEPCTMCRKRRALGPREGRDIDSAREGSKRFWKVLGGQDAVHEPRFGEERLCAVCLFKRLFVTLGTGDVGDPNRTWTGSDPRWAERPKGGLRFPFPSTATVAAQPWLQWVLRDASLETELGAFRDEAYAQNLPRTSFSAALPCLSHLDQQASNPRLARDLLELDGQMFHPSALAESLRRDARQVPSRGAGKGAASGKEAEDLPVCKASRDLRKASRDRWEADGKPSTHPATPPTRVAVLAMDGDSLGRLLLGTTIKATWGDVLHPDVASVLAGRPGWADEIKRRRGVGPSLHAAISRMLVDFAHRVVPWVIEQEFRGRLIYAGGDDILALLPADDALPAAARLQALYTTPWLLDTRDDLPNGDVPPDHVWNAQEASQRFQTVPTSVPLTRKGARLLALPGPHHTLSAGIAYGHFKTPLAQLLSKARTLLDDLAKEQLGRSAFAVALYSRGGVKVATGARWRPPGASAETADAATQWTTVTEGFRRGKLPGKLPYQLQEPARALASLVLRPSADGRAAPRPEVPTLRPEVEASLVVQLLGAAGGGEWRGGNADPLTEAVTAMLRAGVEAARRHAEHRARVTGDSARIDYDAAADAIVAPLRFARALADAGEEDAT